MLHKLLLIEDETYICRDGVRQYLTAEAGFDCQQSSWIVATSHNLPPVNVELVVLAGSASPDLPLNLFHWLRQNPIGAPTLAVLMQDSGNEMLQSAVESVDDFIFAPVRKEELQCRLRRMLGAGSSPELENEEAIRANLKQELGLAQLIGDDPAFLRVIQSIPGIAASSSPVLLLGETGTGKELCAQAIHSLSARHDQPFVPVECGAIPENLAENELFGHARGAFTDAHSDQKGLASMAEGGTLFLDEIDSLPLTAQAKLLHFPAWR